MLFAIIVLNYIILINSFFKQSINVTKNWTNFVNIIFYPTQPRSWKPNKKYKAFKD